MIKNYASAIALAVGALSLPLAVYAGEGSTAEPSASLSGLVMPAVSAGPLKAHKTFTDSATTGNTTPLPAGANTPVGATMSIKCTLATGCPVVATLVAQVRGAATASSVGIGFWVNNACISCPFTDVLPAAPNNYFNQTTQATAMLPFGTHDLQMRVYSSVATTAHHYAAKYEFYKLP